jgi:glycerophosphoryl diester phosphodiesterase
MSRPLLLGHRGARSLRTIPENTVASFDRALADGCDGFEFDLRLTADGHAVVCHDPKIGGLDIARTGLQEVPGLNSLEEVLNRYPRAFLDIELKVSGLESTVIEQVSKRPDTNFVVSSFLPAVLESIHSASATVPLGLICETKAEVRGWRELPIEYLIVHYKLARPELIEDVHNLSKKIMVWTVNRADSIRQFAERGVDGIISDDPKQLAGILKRSTLT